ncbi:MAG: type II toxin-antitoxin system HicA family toxin [Proteobacteria bacterium]|nr:type II toxin-antitoxin system HicA family toxin [Pseudomonadota bacterium]MBS0464347.1 type II toxin-antitoxin system HicA family toxin [Pseudomonadota bacterium]
MKLPRDVDAKSLIKALGTLGYRPTRQTGSHIRLSRLASPAHSLTIPNHAPIKLGTLNAILVEVAAYQRMDKSTLITTLFG